VILIVSVDDMLTVLRSPKLFYPVRGSKCVADGVQDN
jgi:hypothetical protein